MLQQFYLVSQLENESVADYSVRIENLPRRATQNRPIHEIVRNEMLCARLWNGLRDSRLKNSCRFMYETEKDFNKLRKSVRSVEQDRFASAAAKQLSSSSASSADSKPTSNKDSKSMAQAADKSSQKFDTVFNQMKQLREKLHSMEKKFAEASLQSKPSEPSSSPSNPPSQNSYQRGRCRPFRGRGSRGRGRGFYNRSW